MQTSSKRDGCPTDWRILCKDLQWTYKVTVFSPPPCQRAVFGSPLFSLSGELGLQVLELGIDFKIYTFVVSEQN